MCRKKDHALQRVGGQRFSVYFLEWKNPAASKWSGKGLGQEAPKRGTYLPKLSIGTRQNLVQTPALPPISHSQRSLIFLLRTSHV